MLLLLVYAIELNVVILRLPIIDGDDMIPFSSKVWGQAGRARELHEENYKLK